MKPTFFPTPAAFREWLEQHHAAADVLLVGFHKVGSDRPSITWPESVDEALCFGWIDGVRKNLDASRDPPNGRGREHRLSPPPPAFSSPSIYATTRIGRNTSALQSSPSVTEMAAVRCPADVPANRTDRRTAR
jgi:hypothetical protein